MTIDWRMRKKDSEWSAEEPSCHFNGLFLFTCTSCTKMLRTDWAEAQQGAVKQWVGGGMLEAVVGG